MAQEFIENRQSPVEEKGIHAADKNEFEDCSGMENKRSRIIVVGLYKYDGDGKELEKTSALDKYLSSCTGDGSGEYHPKLFLWDIKCDQA